MKKEYKVNLRSRLRHFWPIYIYLFPDIGFVFYANYSFGTQDLMLYINIAIVMFMIVFIPTIYVHIEYILTSRGMALTVDDQDQLLKIKTKNSERLIRFDDIVLFEQFKTPPLIDKRQQWLPWASYNYVTITTSNNERFVITCFLIDEFELKIPKDRIKLTKALYPSINRFDLKALLD